MNDIDYNRLQVPVRPKSQDRERLHRVGAPPPMSARKPSLTDIDISSKFILTGFFLFILRSISNSHQFIVAPVTVATSRNTPLKRMHSTVQESC